MAINDFPYRVTAKVRFADVDARGHVNNTAYYSYFEIARTTFFSERPFFADAEHAGREPVLVHQAANYRRAIQFPSDVVIGMRLKELRDRSFSLEFAIVLAGNEDVFADGLSTHVWLDVDERKARPIPPELAAILKELKTTSGT